jgi:FkbM family methyltransferase
MSIFKKLISINDLVFDVGSNMGDKSEIFLNLGAKVIGFEPQNECYELTKEKFKSNNNFIPKNIALSNNSGVEIMYVANHHTISSMSHEFISETKKSRFKGANWDEKIEVKTDTLDNVILEYGTPNFIKIDVEGYELNVLKGLSKPINLISIEFTPELCESTINCIEYIDNINSNNTDFNYGSRNDDFFKFEEWLDKKTIKDYLMSVNDYVFEFGDVYCRQKK